MTLIEALRYSTDNRTHADFVDAALANPTQEVHPLAYADWLQEQGQEGLAEQVRLAVKGRSALRSDVGYTASDSSVITNSPVNVDVGGFWGYNYEGKRKGGCLIHSHHLSSDGKTEVSYISKHNAEEALSLLNQMVGLSGQEEALRNLHAEFDLAPDTKAEN